MEIERKEGRRREKEEGRNEGRKREKRSTKPRAVLGIKSGVKYFFKLLLS